MSLDLPVHVPAPYAADRKPLIAADGDELRTLLAPVTPAEFVRDYWAKRPLFVKGFRAKYQGFFDGEMFTRAVSAPGPVPDEFLRASFDRKTETGLSAVGGDADAWRSSVFRATPDQAVPLFAAGATLCVSQIERRAPALVPFLAAIKRQLGFPGKVSFNAYLSPAGSGFNWHFDSRIASTLQIEGTKRWRFSNSTAIDWPRSNGTLRADGTPFYTDEGVVAGDGEHLVPVDETNVTEVVLEPGDLLVLPAGSWHEACGGDAGSLALNLSFTAVSYTVMMRQLLDGLLSGEPGWRAPAPVLPGADPGACDPAGLAAITAQLRRAGEVLGSLRGDSAAVVRMWEAFVQNPNPGVAPLPMPPAAVAPITPQQRLRVRHDGNLAVMLADGATRLCITVGTSRSFDVIAPALDFVRRVLREREFLAGGCLAWNDSGAPYAWNDVAELLTGLLHEGLLEFAA